jgi:DNA-binding GntR family transcriptional regulator
MSKSKVRPLRRSEQLREQLEERIVTGVYPPGARLDEQELAESFGVSRTPVREALIQLAAGGLIDLRPRRGAIIPDMSAERLYEMFEVMAELEAMCGRLAARRIHPDELERLQSAHKACAAAHQGGDPDRYYQLNEIFHKHIYAASHNGFLAEQAVALHLRMRPYRRLQLRVRNRMGASFQEHTQIVEAIAAGDGERTAAMLRAHVVIQGERFTDLVASLRQFNAQERPAAAAALTASSRQPR